MIKLLKCIAAAFLPERCPYCDRAVPAGKPACRDCLSLIPQNAILSFAKGGYICASPFLYKGIFSKTVKSYKFNGHVYYTEKLVIQLKAAVTEAYGDIKFDCVTCVPMHKNQIKERGYNQSKLLAKGLAKEISLPYEDLLIKHIENEPQHTLVRQQKRQNVKGVYKETDADKIKGKSILIIDDVITTGYTLGECCKTLRKTGAAKICCATLCAKNSA